MSEQVHGQYELDLDTEVTMLLPLMPEASHQVFLPPFSGGKSCSKCGTESPRMTYHVGANTYLPCIAIYNGLPKDTFGCPIVPVPEHIDRVCLACEFAWYEDIKRSGL